MEKAPPDPPSLFVRGIVSTTLMSLEDLIEYARMKTWNSRIEDAQDSASDSHKDMILGTHYWLFQNTSYLAKHAILTRKARRLKGTAA